MACDRLRLSFTCDFFDAGFDAVLAGGGGALGVAAGLGAAGGLGVVGDGTLGDVRALAVPGAVGDAIGGGSARRACQRHATVAAPTTTTTTTRAIGSRRCMRRAGWRAGCGGGGGASSDRAVLSERIWLSVTPSVFSGGNAGGSGRFHRPIVTV